MNNNEQWLSTGDCSLCRKRKYCGKLCKAAKNRKHDLIAGAMVNIMCDVLSKTNSK